jgi:hypothetical protein
VQCPKCNSTEVHTEERGWSWRTGLFRSGQMLLTCRSCGSQFRLGEGGSVGKEVTEASELQDFVVFGVIIFLVSAFLKRC